MEKTLILKSETFKIIDFSQPGKFDGSSWIDEGSRGSAGGAPALADQQVRCRNALVVLRSEDRRGDDRSVYLERLTRELDERSDRVACTRYDSRFHFCEVVSATTTDADECFSAMPLGAVDTSDIRSTIFRNQEDARAGGKRAANAAL